jgi:hypothetical protein
LISYENSLFFIVSEPITLSKSTVLGKILYFKSAGFSMCNCKVQTLRELNISTIFGIYSSRMKELGSGSRLLVIIFALLSQDIIWAKEAHPIALLVEPDDLVLTNFDETAQLLVTFQMSDGTFKDATRLAKYSTAHQLESQANVVTIKLGKVKPRDQGITTIVINVEDFSGKMWTATAKATVRDLDPKRELNFVNDIVPILTKSGCNAGGCHGKSGGQNGFHLSLFGFDPDFDYEALTRQGRGRRVFPPAPDLSLILQKPAGQMAHGGGVRLEKQSDAYHLLRRWISQGVPKGASDRTVTRIDVSPQERSLSCNSQQQLRVVAHYSDGSAQDVTQVAEYKSQQPDVLNVDSDGYVTVGEHTGEGIVMVRYMNVVDVARIVVPFSENLPSAAYSTFTPRNFIDDLVMAKWKRIGIAPSAICSDEEFLRRAMLDGIGTLPTAEEVKQFVNDSSTDKRKRLIERTLSRREYADFWANIWGDLLRNKRRNVDTSKRGSFMFAAWLRDAFARNMPYDQFVREILTAEGSVSDSPPVIWYREVRNPVHQVNDTSQLFLGTRISCANCHHHPYEKWSQEDYWGFAAFFERIGTKPDDGPDEQVILVKKEGETRVPRTKKVVKPKALGGAEYECGPDEDPRTKLAEWMTSSDNAHFAKAIANRIWGHFMGHGLVEAVDDLRVSNPPTNPQLLDRLARELVDHKFNLKYLIRTIMDSETYGLSSAPTPHNERDRQNYARYTPRRLSAETLLDAVGAVTGSPEKFPGFPAGTRAIELPDNAVNSDFMDVFGRSHRESACECERSYAPNLSQFLYMMNASDIQGKIADPRGTLSKLLRAGEKDKDIIEELYVRAYARLPKANELKDALAFVAGSSNHRAALEDFEWMLVNSKEFLFNH